LSFIGFPIAERGATLVLRNSTQNLAECKQIDPHAAHQNEVIRVEALTTTIPTVTTSAAPILDDVIFTIGLR
jgi:hypothetical protein